MPDPDLPPIPLTPRLLREARRRITLLPDRVLETILSDGAPRHTAWSITQTPSLARLYLQARTAASDKRLLARLLGVDLKGELRRQNRDPHDPGSLPPPETITHLLRLHAQGVPYEAIKGILIPKIAANPHTPPEKLEPPQASITPELIRQTLQENKKAVCDYKKGRKKALNYLVGQVIKKIGKKAVDPRELRKLIQEELDKQDTC